jgi:hypothetical protein
MKASIPGVQTTFFKSLNIRHSDVFTALSVRLKKHSEGPKGLIGPPCHGVSRTCSRYRNPVPGMSR